MNTNKSSNANYKCFGVFKSMFCSQQKGIAFKIFNKQLTEEKYYEVVGAINIPFKKVAWTNHAQIMEAYEKDKETCHGENLIKINDYDTRKEAWRPVITELMTLRTLDIWDSEANTVVEEITGWNLDAEANQTDDKMQEAMELLKSNGYKIVKE